MSRLILDYSDTAKNTQDVHKHINIHKVATAVSLRESNRWAEVKVLSTVRWTKKKLKLQFIDWSNIEVHWA